MTLDRVVLSTASGMVVRLATRAAREPMPGEVEVAVRAAAIGRDDALLALGRDAPPLPRPLVPGSDLAGVVLRSAHPRWRRGDDVVMTGHGLGRGPEGGWAERTCVPGALLLPLPPGLSHEEAAVIGTPGLAAMRAAEVLDEAGIPPEAGAVLVTGASGGLGTLAVLALRSLEYRVVALTRRPALAPWLAGLGAAETWPLGALREA
ncbi:alcohol dehydrogenase catalytic domain-containing protein, partial [Falsiroseomonas selenitidurans]